MSHWRNASCLALVVAGRLRRRGRGPAARRRRPLRARGPGGDDPRRRRPAAANDAYVAYSRGKLDQDEAVTKMRAAEQTITGVRDGVAVLDHPAPVRPPARPADALPRPQPRPRRRDDRSSRSTRRPPRRRSRRSAASIGGCRRGSSTPATARTGARARRFGAPWAAVTDDLRALDAATGARADAPRPAPPARHHTPARRASCAAHLRSATRRGSRALLKRFRAASRSGGGCTRSSARPRSA